MNNSVLQSIISEEEHKDLLELLSVLSSFDNKILLRNDILSIFEDYCDKNNKEQNFCTQSSVVRFITKIQEMFLKDDYLVIMHRYQIARYRFYLLRADGAFMEEIDVAQYLNLKDHHVQQQDPSDRHLRIDLLPFYDYTPTIKDPRSIGNGTRYLNRYLCSNIFNKPDEWNNNLYQFLKLHTYNEKQLLINGSILQNYDTFFAELQNTVHWLEGIDPEVPYKNIETNLQTRGFEPGWGNTAGRMLETMQILIDLINEPADTVLEQFLSRIPMPLISKIAIISPHGWFAQENVLGRPDTGGQVIYILDQVRALEKHLKQEIALSGLDMKPTIIVLTRFISNAEGTTCNVRKEKIHHTDNCWILRIPFKDSHHNIVENWISRFHIWPYLEQFAEDASLQLVSEFSGRPDLIIGNYSDGNMVASLISDKLNVIQCTIAHALEKTKYLFSDLYWMNNEDNYHFSLQFTADLISMNKSDFIISSTHQEIIGTDDSMGQYESYQFFTLPGLYQVTGGVNLYAPKFNVIPPGVDEGLYFPYYEKEHRVASKTGALRNRLFTDESDDIFGSLDDPQKPPIFTMARFDRIKNITGLIEAFGRSSLLQERCNLVFAAGTIHQEESHDHEEREEIQRAYDLISHYKLQGKVRWLPSINKLETGEVYRIMADQGGMFVQPALFEAFGLTILEAMLSGLPTFGPLFGGPLEIIEPGKSGYLLNTSSPERIAAGIEEFINDCEKDSSLWQRISEQGISRVREHFTWKLYSERLIRLAKLYGFWRYAVSGSGKIEMDRYCDLLYYFLFKQRAHELMPH